MRRIVLVLCGLLGACSVGNTGNPQTTSGGSPEGITLLRSKLAHDTAPALSEAERAQFERDQQALTFALFEALSPDHPNLFFSPHSIATALAMTYAGALGETKAEMKEALSFSLPEPTLHAAFNATALALARRADEVEPGDGGDGFALSTTNAQFVQGGTEVQPAFLDVLAQHYDAGLFLANFAGDPEHERLAINAWARERTAQRVDELLPPMSLSTLTKLVLVNAIYFKGSWANKFDPSKTQDATFHAPEGDRTVPMMQGGGRFGYVEGDGYRAVELPYVSRAVRMLLILPDQGRQGDVEARLKDGLFAQALAGLSEQQLSLGLPRFSFSNDLDLVPSLEKLGMKRAFADADFSGIAGAPGWLYIAGVYHQAFIAVDEKGTEAAAATAVVLNGRSIATPISFDRPFLFAVYDQPTGEILFAGRVSAP